MEELWDFVAFGLVFLQPLIQIIFKTFQKIFSNHMFKSSPYAYIYGLEESPFWRQSLALAFFAAAPAFLLISGEFANFRNGFALVLGGLVFVFVAGASAYLAVPVLHYSKTSNLFQYLEDRFQSRFLNWAAVCLHIFVTLFFGVILLSLSSHLSAFLLPVDSAIITAAFGAAISLAILIGGFSSALHVNFFSSLIVFLPAFLATIIYCAVRNLTNWRLISWTEADLGFSGAKFGPISAAFFAIPMGLQLILGSQASFQYLVSNGVAKKAQTVFGITVILTVSLVAVTVLFSMSIWSVFETICEPNPVTSGYKAAILAIVAVWRGNNIPAVSGYTISALVWAGPCVFGMNLLTISTVIWEQILRKRYAVRQDACQTSVVRAVCAVFSIISIGASMALLNFAPEFLVLSRKLILLSASLFTPVTGLVFSGIFLPCANKIGATSGLFVGLTVVAVYGMGHIYFDTDIQQERLLEMQQNCSFTANFSTTTATTLTTAMEDAILPLFNETTPFNGNFSAMGAENAAKLHDIFSSIFALSPYFHPFLGLFVTFLTTFIVSMLSGMQDIYLLDWNLVYSTCTNCGNRQSLSYYSGPRSVPPFITSQSFRYAEHSSLPDTNYANPKVQAILEEISESAAI